jgi:hypothetical protein
MFIIRLSGLSMTDVEDLVARIWCALEEHHVASPILSVDAVAGALNIGFRFRTKEDAERITRAVPALAAPRDAKELVLAGAGWAN